MKGVQKWGIASWPKTVCLRLVHRGTSMFKRQQQESVSEDSELALQNAGSISV
jgi:hypothetical protein